MDENVNLTLLTASLVTQKFAVENGQGGKR